MSEDVATCPVCGSALQESARELQRRDGYRYSCRRCGNFDLVYGLQGERSFDRVRHLVSAWIRRQNKAGVAHPLVPGDPNTPPDEWLMSLEHMSFPEATDEKLDALLLAEADVVKGQPGKVVKLHLYPQLISEVAARNPEETYYLNELLQQLDYIDFAGSDNRFAKIKVKGWQRIGELRKSNNSSDSAFLAMWFDDCTKEYRKASIAAVEYCRYRPIVIDQQEFNDFIMNQVVSSIRQARFVIADFTCRPETAGSASGKIHGGVRGGVYWEAGLAKGLGKEVIHTCEDEGETRERLHFDVDQYKTIFWKHEDLKPEIRDLSHHIEDPTFAERLAANILGTIGKGSYTRQSES